MDLRAGKFVVVIDDEDRENEGDLIACAEKMTEESMAFMIRHSSGLVCVGMTGEDLDRLDLPLMVPNKKNDECMTTAFTHSVDLKAGTSTGISASDRAKTLVALADANIAGDAFARPGHIFPLRARPHGVLERPGHTEAAVDLSRLAGCAPVGVLCEIVDHNSGRMMRTPELRAFSTEYDLKCITIRDLMRYRLRMEEQLVRGGVTAKLPTKFGTFDVTTFASKVDGCEHVVLSIGQLRGAEDVLVRVHSENLLGDVFASSRDDGCDQLSAALARIANEGRGALVYMRGHEGRGAGLGSLLHSLNLQAGGLDTVSASEKLGLSPDARSYTSAGLILRALGLQSARLMTNNPSKYEGVQGLGVTILGREPIVTCSSPLSEPYLSAKRDKLGHAI